MINAYETEGGDILPFNHVIRVMRMSETVRVYFVVGSVDLMKEDAEEFLASYKDWLSAQYRYSS